MTKLLAPFTRSMQSVQSMFSHLQVIRQLSQIIGLIGRKWVIVSVVSSLALTCVEYSLAVFIQLFLHSLGLIDVSSIPEFLRGLASDNLLLLLTAMVVIGLVRGIATFGTLHATCMLGHLIEVRLRNLTLYSMLKSKERKFIANSKLNWLFSEVFPKTSTAIGCYARTTPCFIQVVSLLAILFVIGWKEALVSCAGLIVVGVITLILNKRVVRNSVEVPKTISTTNRIIQRVTRNWIFVRIGGVENSEYNHLTHAFRRYVYYLRKANIFASTASILPQWLGVMLLAIIVWSSKMWFGSDEAFLLMFLYIFLRFVQQLSLMMSGISAASVFIPQIKESISYYQSHSQNVQNGAASFDKTMQGAHLLKSQKPIANPSSLPIRNVKEESQPIAISLQSVSFKWNHEENWLFDNLNLEIPAGSVFGIVGPSGSGKSTLINLIIGLLKPTKGTVNLGNVSAEQYLEKHNESIGYVGADPFLIDGSIQENLKYGLRCQVTDAEMFAALDHAQLGELVRKLPGKLEYQISEIGEGLSTGQKQRLALTRALLRYPKILILDEATANLDIKTELLIRDYIVNLRGRCSVLVISHKPTLLEVVDDKIDLDAVSK